MKIIINKDRSVIPVGTWGTVNENDYEILNLIKEYKTVILLNKTDRC